MAPAHRHTPAALRFVLEGEGVWTLVDGDPIAMAAGDLVLTPSWTFHEHHNPGDESMMWLDVLDLPVVAALDAVFFELGPSESGDARTDPTSESERRFGAGRACSRRRSRSSCRRTRRCWRTGGPTPTALSRCSSPTRRTVSRGCGTPTPSAAGT